ncbi:MAG TPA: ABC transporter ATP-binding protein [Candidatus Binatia bacterium]|jgi:iron(III) transport system ATP-binding protein
MIRIENLHVRYQTERGEVYAVQGIDLDVKPGQFFTLLGPSGCGKTTTLRSVAGLERPFEGEISVGDQLVFSSRRKISIPPYKRDIGMVFQSYAIWPHMNVFENVAFPLRESRQRLSGDEIRARVRKALAMVQLDGLEDRPAPFLSGGQQQRLALARALVKEPRVLLLDEPLSNLDAKLREETRFEMRELVKRLAITTLYVTHDQLEALTMSDVIAVMDSGRIVQRGTPLEIYGAPQDRFVANFIGLSNFLEGKVKQTGALGEVETPSGMLKCVLPDGIAAGEAVVVVIRPEDVNLNAGAPSQNENILEGKIEAIVYMGDALECQVAVGAKLIRLKLHPSSPVARGNTVRLRLPAESCRAVRA